MSDLYLEVTNGWPVKRLSAMLKLPIPIPERLRRERGGYSANDLADRAVIVGGGATSALARPLAKALAEAQINAYGELETDRARAFDAHGEAFGRKTRSIESLGERGTVEGLVFDASGITDVGGLRSVYDFFHANVGKLKRSGKVVLIASAGEEDRVIAKAIEGFTRSLSKEIGKRGATANVLVCDHDVGDAIEGPVRFFLSGRSAFVTGQPLRVNRSVNRNGAGQRSRVLEGKIALVTGAARGIGEATATVLAREGAKVVLVDREEEGAALAKLARTIGGVPVLADLASDHAPQILADAVKPLGGVDVVVHNAGVTRDKTIARMKLEAWDMALAVNLLAPMRAHAALEPLLRDGGRVIALSSIAGIAGNVGQTNYAASKAGIAAWIQSISGKLAPRGITANAIAPGFIETRMTAAIPVPIREAGRRMSSLGQGGLPEDVAEAVLFLSTDGAQGIDGATLRVCGGSLVGA